MPTQIGTNTMNFPDGRTVLIDYFDDGTQQANTTFPSGQTYPGAIYPPAPEPGQ